MDDELLQKDGALSPDALAQDTAEEFAVMTEPDVAVDEQTAADAQPQSAESAGKQAELPPEKKKGIKAWWSRHKPSKRRLIQVYAMLLYNAHAKGFIKGEIFTGMTKYACVPGLNCYSCPGAVGACPLGALQNALASTGARAPYYIFGIILLYGLILGRTICGFLCPMGLGQDLLYKIRSPKLKKSRVTYVLSYLKYVILVVLAVGIPLMYATSNTTVPGFCKYICPAGTVEGAVLLLIHPSNDALYKMLGSLFTWKTAVLIIVFTASIFIYRFFCRFLCPLGALYGLFNKFALLGVTVDKDKCTKCGKCVAQCKMDIKKVGDHECINCGECMSACPTKAIRWKGSKLFFKNVDDALQSASPEQKVSIASVAAQNGKISPAKASVADMAMAADAASSDVGMGGDGVRKDDVAAGGESAPVAVVRTKKHDRQFRFKVVCICLAAILYIGVFTYANFFASAEEEPAVTYDMVVGLQDGETGFASFTVGGGTGYVVPTGGSGTESDPYTVSSLVGIYDLAINSADSRVYFRYTASAAATYAVEGSDKLDLRIYYVLAGTRYALYNRENDGDSFTLSLERPAGYGNGVGDLCYDFTLDCYNGRDKVTLSALRGKTVVINFWYTTCGPCVLELPEFEKVRAERTDVEIIAIHNVSPNTDVQAFLDEMHWDEWGIIFAQDTGAQERSDMYALFGGRNNAYPRTLVVDATGVVRSVFEGRIAEEVLAQAVDAASGK